MATFEERINDLIGSYSDQDAMDTFMSDGLKEIYNLLPKEKLLECITHTELSNSPSTLDLDTVTVGPVISVTRKTAEGYGQLCRKISAALSSRVTDPNDLLYVTETDPVFFIKNAVLNVFPDPTATQTAEVMYLPLTAVDASAHTKIDNLSNDVEYIVVLYAAIKCAESLLASEEDEELYVPIIKGLRSDYIQSLTLVGAQGMKEFVSATKAKK